MFKKFFTIVITALVGIVGIGPGSPASATSTFSQTFDLPDTTVPNLLIPLSDNSTIAIWQARENGGSRVRSALMSKEGTFTNQQELFNAGNGFAQIGKQSQWVRLADGTIALGFSNAVNAGSNYIAKSYIIYTDDGVEWSAPIEVLTTQIKDDNNCEFEEQCSYRDPKLALDGKGNLFFGAVYWESYFVTSSRNGLTWDTPTEVQVPSGGSAFSTSVIGLSGGGFLTTWAVMTDVGVIRKFSRMASGSTTYWTRATLLADGLGYSGSRDSLMVQTGIDKYTVVFQLGRNDGSLEFVAKTFDSKTRAWSSQISLISPNVGWPTSEYLAVPNADGGVSIFFSYALNGSLFSQGQTAAYIYKTDIKNGLRQGETVSVSSSTSQGFQLIAVRKNFDQTTSLIERELSGAARIRSLTGAQTGETTVIPFGFLQNGTPDQVVNVKAAFSPNGNIFMAGSGNVERKGIVLVQASAPTANALPSIRGTAKKGSKLTAGAIVFSSFSGISATSYQWYACTTPVPVNTNAKPANCSAISKAKASTFKVTSKQKGKYVTVAYTNSNPVGTATMFAPSATKAK